MVQLAQAFDSDQHGEMNTFEPIPAAVYPMQIVKSEICVTKKKDGKYIKFEMMVLDGTHKGKRVWVQLNIINPSEIAVKIANEELAAIAKACGKPKFQDTEELHGIPMNVTVRIKAAKGDFPPQNAASKYAALGVKPGVAAKTPAKTKKPVKAEKKKVASGPGWDK